MGDADSARQARALEGILAQLTLLVGLQKKQTEKMLNVDELRELRTASGRLVGYMLPGEKITLTEFQEHRTSTPMSSSSEIAHPAEEPLTMNDINAVVGLINHRETLPSGEMRITATVTNPEVLALLKPDMKDWTND